MLHSSVLSSSILTAFYLFVLNTVTSGFSVQNFCGGLYGSKLALSSISLNASPRRIEVNLEKPLGVVLEENKENESEGVFCFECKEESSAYVAGIRQGDVVTSLDGRDATSLSFDQVLDLISSAESPIAITLDRYDVVEKSASTVKPKVKMSPKRMPSAKKLAKASTNINFWKDPLMIGSLAFTVLFPLGIYLASKLK